MNNSNFYCKDIFYFITVVFNCSIITVYAMTSTKGCQQYEL